MAYGTSPDAFDEYLQIAERTSRECLDHFTKCIHVLYYDKFLRRPTATDIQKNELHEEKHGLPGMLGSIDSWSTFVKTFSVARDEKTLKFKRVQEAARKDIERAFEVLQDEGFEVNLRDVFVNPAPNIVRDWVERCDLHVRKTNELRDRKTHIDLRQDLMEHL
ncbi:nucleotide-binding alpha-beta plait domain-containing protein [Tanacetum coccineum]